MRLHGRGDGNSSRRRHTSSVSAFLLNRSSDLRIYASRFAELLGEVLGDTKSNLEARIAAEKGACEDKFRIAKLAKEQGSDAIHDTVHEMAKDEARHCAGFAGLYKRYFK